MTFAYFDCFAGVAGDMIVGSLLDAGLSFDDLKSELAKLKLSGYKLKAEKVAKNHISATKFTVEVKTPQPHRSLSEIARIISDSTLSDNVKKSAINIFNRLACAEASAHGEEVEDVHFHEVGAVDAIIDVCAASLGLGILKIDKVYSSPLSLGRGMISTQHGMMPVPAPAVAELVKDIPSRLTNIDSELTTPTGAAILKEFAVFEDPGLFVVECVGYGAGAKNLPEIPNLLRIVIGRLQSQLSSENIAVIETNLDRVSPETLGSLIDELLKAGALDAFVTPVVMKKNRPGHLFSVLCDKDKTDKLVKTIFARGKTLGVRIKEVERLMLPRHEVMVKTSGGEVSVKMAELEGQKLIFPEYEDMLKAMEKAKTDYDSIYFEICRVVKERKN